MIQTIEQSLIIEFDYPFDDLDPLFGLEMQLGGYIEENGLGQYDGNEIGLDTTDARIYMYSPDAQRVLKEIRPFLQAAPFMKNAIAMMRLGPPDKPAKCVEEKV